MSFFMNNAAGNQSVNMQNMAMAEQELEMVSDLFNRYGLFAFFSSSLPL